MDVIIRVDAREAEQMISQAPVQIRRAMRMGMEDATALLLRDMRDYPTQRPGSTYIRTHTLDRSWNREVKGQFMAVGDELRGVIFSNGNIAPYNRLVQDDLFQAQVHRGRWLTVQDIQRLRQQDVQRVFEARLQAELR